MSGRIVGEVLEWLRTPAAEGLTQQERLILIGIADRIIDERLRRMVRFSSDTCNLYERLCEIVGSKSVKDALQRLSERGVEVRVEWRKDKNGDPVFAGKGHAMEFYLPPLLWTSIPETQDLEACG